MDNQTALVRNISLAKALTESFVEIYDMNSPDSAFHFTKTEVESTKEYPEQHFYLQAEIDDLSYQFSFWKDHVFVELGADGDTNMRFNHLRNYAAIIFTYDFQNESPTEAKLLNTDVGFEVHMKEYCRRVGFVEKVRQLHNPSV